MPITHLAAMAATVALSTTPAAAARVELVSAVKDAKDPDTCLSVREVSYAPGQGSRSHSHDATVIAYVLRGAVESQVGNEPLRTYHAGDHWVEAPRTQHKISRNASASEPATFLAIMLAHRGAEEAQACAN